MHSKFIPITLLEYIYIKGVSSSPFIIEVVRWGNRKIHTRTHVHHLPRPHEFTPLRKQNKLCVFIMIHLMTLTHVKP